MDTLKHASTSCHEMRRKNYREKRERESKDRDVRYRHLVEQSTWTSPSTIVVDQDQREEQTCEEEKEECLYRGVVNIDGKRSLLRLRSKRSSDEVIAVATETSTGNQIEVKVSQRDANEIIHGNAESILRGLFHFD